MTSSNSGLQGQEGLDRTALDIQVFARGGAEPAQQQNVSAFAAEEEEINIDESEEDGINISTLSNNVRRRQSNLSNVKLQARNSQSAARNTSLQVQTVNHKHH